MIFGFDLDGVIYPWHRYAWEWYVKKTKDPISFDAFWRFPNGYVATHEGSDIIIEMVNASETYWKFSPTLSVQVAVDKIAEMAKEIWYITSRPIKVKKMTAKWLETYEFPYHKNLIFADEVEFRGKSGKLGAIYKTGCDYYVEDRPKYLETLSSATNLFIVNTPYNTYRHFNGIRVDHIIEIPNYLEDKHHDRFNI